MVQSVDALSLKLLGRNGFVEIPGAAGNELYNVNINYILALVN